MKLNFKTIILISTAFFLFSECSNNILTSKSVKLKNINDSISYALGIIIGENNIKDIEKSPIKKNYNKNLLINGFITSLKEREYRISYDTSRILVNNFIKKNFNDLSLKNKIEGETFLKQNKTKKDVITTKSGLQYKILKKGYGESPIEGSHVQCKYKGMFIDGTEFENSKDQGKSVEFVIGHTIPGWDEALKMMHLGSKWELYIPSDLAYGEKGTDRLIGPNQTLIFDIELVGFNISSKKKK